MLIFWRDSAECALPVFVRFAGLLKRRFNASEIRWFQVALRGKFRVEPASGAML